ncbi:MAG: hypothetical protein IJ193_08550 [Bacilli bacterium]|nr:hypothetical protein [Bacilli bacterium]
MDKVILSPQGRVIRKRKFNPTKKCSTILVDGLTIVLDSLGRMRTIDDMEEYLSYGREEDIDVKEEIARLLLIATTFPTEISPTIDISNKLFENHIVDINSMFIKEFLELEERNKTTSFMKSDFYYQISSKLEEMELRRLIDDSFVLNDSLVLIKNIRNLYLANLDQNILCGNLDMRFREPLVELFQHNLDYTQKKIRNGVMKNNVQLQTRH